MESSATIALAASSAFMLVGLLTGVWRYEASIRSAEGQAPRYVRTAHRASLMYSFACLVLMELALVSRWPDRAERLAVIVPVALFGVATATYVVHALLRDTENQFSRPYRIGSWVIPTKAFEWGGRLLAAGELAGFLTLATGAAIALAGN